MQPPRHPNRRTLMAWGLLPLSHAWSLGLSACTTPPQVLRSTYTEKVSTVMVTQDRQQFVVLGERYHYIFTAPPDVVALLASPLMPLASAQFYPFQVAVDGHTTGSFNLLLPATLTAERVAQAQALGFEQQADGRWLLGGVIEGKRYIQGHTVRTGRVHAQLSHTYVVTVEAEQTRGEQAAQDLASPIAATADGMLMVYFAVLVPILIPLIFLSRETPKKPTPARP